MACATLKQEIFEAPFGRIDALDSAHFLNEKAKSDADYHAIEGSTANTSRQEDDAGLFEQSAGEGAKRPNDALGQREQKSIRDEWLQLRVSRAEGEVQNRWDMPFIPGVPQAGEYASFYSTYIQNAHGISDPIEALNKQLAETLALLNPLDESKQLFRYAPEKWSVKEVVVHMIDSERIFAYRALRIGRGDQTPLASFEEKPYVAAAEANACDWQELLEEFEHVRKASILLLSHLPHAAWIRTGTASGQTISVRALAYIIAGHVGHHTGILRERYLL